MKILVVCQHYWPENFRVTEICETLAAKGHQVTALVGLPNYPTGIIPQEYRHHRNRRQQRNGVEIRRCFEIGRKQTKLGLAVNYVSYMTSACLKGLFLRKDYGVIYCFSTSPVLMSYPGVWLKKLFGKKLLIYVLDIWPACLAAMNVREGALLYRIMTHVSRHIYRSADRLLYSSYPFGGYLKDVHGIVTDESQYLPQFADDLFDSDQNHNNDRKPDEGISLLFAGNIGKAQSVDCFVRAAALLKDENIRWHIIGDGTCYDQVQSLTSELQVTDRVTFYGRRPLDEMPSFYEKADALLVSMVDDPLMNQTLPGKVQSYMAAGKPVIGAIAGEACRVIHEADCGLCCKPDEPQALAECIRTFASLSEERVAEMGSNARKYYDRHFSKTVHMQRLEGELQKLAKR